MSFTSRKECSGGPSKSLKRVRFYAHPTPFLEVYRSNCPARLALAAAWSWRFSHGQVRVYTTFGPAWSHLPSIIQ